MTTVTDVVNRALQMIGTRTSVTDSELANNTSNEAIQANISLYELRDDLTRMAPWSFAQKTANLTYITSSPGTPENPIAQTTLWGPGQPMPPWNYEYQYPNDALRILWIIPATQTGFSGGIPITTAVTGGAPSFWQGPPVKFKTANDQFYPITAVTVAAGGTGYAVGDVITLAQPSFGSSPVGAPAKLTVLTVLAGAVQTATVQSQINQTPGATPSTPFGGSYFSTTAGPIAQASTSGSGTGATFTPTWGAQGSQRVILTNQEFATATYMQVVTDPNLMDPSFRQCWSTILGANLTMALAGDKKLANMLVNQANATIMQARANDANEGLTVNDITPDWIRIRGFNNADPYTGGFTGFDWGGLFPVFS
jgi:hypothetical protein